ncbi:DNA-binding transcription repressor [Mortierella polycephala]|uniref:DNA-binding transcription repressor n=1 Tax=Mortierella polycephala TaxID=41804 RepID=A0A9P6PKP6_9FUNG|nr:DNA-binding transcription repressor [Mortierella polycephala]
MSQLTAAPSATAQTTLADHSRSSHSRMRVSLSSLKNLASEGKVHLTERDIQALERKGVHLRLGTNAKAPIGSVVSTSDSDTLTPAIATTPFKPMPLRSFPDRFAPTPIATEPRFTQSIRTFTMPSTSKSASPQPMRKSRTSKDGVRKSRPSRDDRDLVIPVKERPLTAYHKGTIEDTCSHLRIPGSYDDRTGLRRHSDTVSMAAKVHAPSVEDTMRRASIATASPVVPSPLGNRTVLYKASSGLTLLSLPETGAIQAPVHTEAMNSFKFPPDGSPSPPPCPVSTPRSKRKSSIPMRSPRWNDSLDESPAVIFQMPFGIPPVPSTSYPSPASSTGAPSTSGPTPEMSQRFQTPPSPLNRSGLGIQVESSFAEPGATHPLESSSSSSSSGASASTMTSQKERQQGQQRPITFTEEDSMSIGEIIIAEQAAAAAATARKGSIMAPRLDDAMPTPPLTSSVQSMRMMGTPSDLQNRNLSTPPTPFTPGHEFGSRQNSSAAGKGTGQQQQREEHEQGEDSPAMLPLWAQRQGNVRRLSFLEFIKGSGTLSSPSTGLNTHGGAHIKNYPPLLSDLVQVVLENVQAVVSETSFEVAEASTTSKATNGKRRRGGSVKKRQGSTGGAKSPDRSIEDDDEDHEGQEEDDHEQEEEVYRRSISHKRRRSSVIEDRESTSPIVMPKSKMLGRVLEHEDVDMEDGDEYIERNHLDDDEGASYNGGQEKSIGSNAHHTTHKPNRRGQLPDYLRIPAEEVEIALQLSREMMESTKRQRQQKQKQQKQSTNKNSHRRPSFKALKPLQDAIMSETGYQEDTHDDAYQSSANSANNSIKVPKKKTKVSSDRPVGIELVIKRPNAKQAKPSDKRCEACDATETPCWRPGYTADTHLCNSCGLRYKKSGVFCPRVGCKYIPLKTEFAAMENERAKSGRAHLICHKCKGSVALPTKKIE